MPVSTIEVELFKVTISMMSAVSADQKGAGFSGPTWRGLKWIRIEMAGKENTGKLSKLKSIFSSKKGDQSSKPQQESSQSSRERTIPPESIKGLGVSIPINRRYQNIKALIPTIEQTCLPEHVAETITAAVIDLIDSPDVVGRQTGLALLHAIIKNKRLELGMLKEYYFKQVQWRKYLEYDHQINLDLLVSLIDNGHDLQYIDNQIGGLLVEWLSVLPLTWNKTQLLELVINIIKYNAAFLDEEHAEQISSVSCRVCNQTQFKDEVLLCINVFESLLRYYYISSSLLPELCATLCYRVLQENYASRAWKLMKELMGTHLGHNVVFTLNHLLHGSTEVPLLRGAVFFLGMALWGRERVESLQVSAPSILPSFRKALKSPNLLVGKDVSTMLLRLVSKFGKNQPAITWELTLDIIQTLLSSLSRTTIADVEIANNISSNIHDTLTSMEQLQEAASYSTSPEQLFKVIESCSDSRPVHSVITLLDYRIEACRPPKVDWADNLDTLFEKYYRNEKRVEVRLKVISLFYSVLQTNRIVHEAEFLDLMLAEFANIDGETDIKLRQKLIDLINNVSCNCFSAKKCVELLELIHKVLCNKKRPGEADTLDASKCLTKLFKSKIMEPNSPEVGLSCLFYLLHYIEICYAPNKKRGNKQVRHDVITLLLSLRSDQNGYLGYVDAEGVAMYSPSVKLINHDSGNLAALAPTRSAALGAGQATELDFKRVLDVLMTCLEEELEWLVLKPLLTQLPDQLQNRILLLSAGHPNIDQLCITVCHQLARRRGLLLPQGVKKPDFDALIYPIVACFSVYQRSLSNKAKLEMVQSFESGLISKSCRTCIHALRVCCLEMETVMLRILPSILKKLSQIADNLQNALPLLQFLSCLVRLPHLYKNFSDDQYRFIFAIALPYTDPFRFTHFAVYLAHHVIAMWFVKCRLIFRHQFVPQIIKGLESNMKAFERNSVSIHSNIASPTPTDSKDGVYDHERLSMFHRELQDTCIDLMARYVYSNCTTSPKRTALSEFLLAGGQSQCWFVGRSLISITSNSSVTNKQCVKCRIVKAGEPVAGIASKSSSSVVESGERRRHRSAAVLPLATSPSSTPASLDDINIHRMTGDGQEATTSNPAGEAMCSCWASGWAEVHIRTAAGDVSWIMRLQNNQVSVPTIGQSQKATSDMSMIYGSPMKSPFPHSSTPSSLHPSAAPPGGTPISRTPHTDEPPRSTSSITPGSAVRRLTLQEESGEEDEPNRLGSPFRRLARRSTSMLGDVKPDIAPRSEAPPIRQISYTDLEHQDHESNDLKPRRSNTISGNDYKAVHKPIRKRLSQTDSGRMMSPSFIFLQLYHSGAFGPQGDAPLRIPDSSAFLESAGVSNLNRIQPFDTHKVAVLYVGKGQEKDESAILSNSFGSQRYSEFLRSLGQLIKLQVEEGVKDDLFVAGLDRSETAADGKYTYTWIDEVVQMVFHITTMMPTDLEDRHAINKKRHIGNDYVTVVYNDSHSEYQLGTIRGKFNYVNIIIKPLDHETSQVSVQCKDEIEHILGHRSTKAISDKSLPDLVKQIALHSSMASQIYVGLARKELFASNWLERLRQIKRLKQTQANSRQSNTTLSNGDFTQYV